MRFRELLSKRGIIVVAVVCAGVLAVSLALPSIAEMQSSRTPSPARSPSRNPPPGSENLLPTPRAASNIPQLSETEKSRVVDIATGNSAVKQLSGGQTPTVKSVAVWHTKNLQLIGAGVELAFNPAIAFDLVVPAFIYDSTETSVPPRFVPSSARLVASNVKSLDVMVDIHSGEVVAFSTRPGSSSSYPNGGRPGARGWDD